MTDTINYITTKSSLLKAIPDIMKYDVLGIDTETTSLDIFTAKWLLLQILSGNTTYIIDVQKCGMDNIKYLISLIKDSEKLTVGFNYKFDLEIILNNTNELLTNVFDLMVAEVLTYNGNGNSYPSLLDVVLKYSGVVLNKEVRKTFENFNGIITQEQILYSAIDVKYLLNEYVARYVAICGISYNMSGFTSRVEAEDMINVHVFRLRAIEKLLIDQKTITYIRGA